MSNQGSRSADLSGNNNNQPPQNRRRGDTSIARHEFAFSGLRVFAQPIQYDDHFSGSSGSSSALSASFNPSISVTSPSLLPPLFPAPLLSSSASVATFAAQDAKAAAASLVAKSPAATAAAAQIFGQHATRNIHQPRQSYESTQTNNNWNGLSSFSSSASSPAMFSQTHHHLNSQSLPFPQHHMNTQRQQQLRSPPTSILERNFSNPSFPGPQHRSHNNNLPQHLVMTMGGRPISQIQTTNINSEQHFNPMPASHSPQFMTTTLETQIMLHQHRLNLLHEQQRILASSACASASASASASATNSPTMEQQAQERAQQMQQLLRHPQLKMEQRTVAQVRDQSEQVFAISDDTTHGGGDVQQLGKRKTHEVSERENVTRKKTNFATSGMGKIKTKTSPKTKTKAKQKKRKKMPTPASTVKLEGTIQPMLTQDTSELKNTQVASAPGLGSASIASVASAVSTPFSSSSAATASSSSSSASAFSSSSSARASSWMPSNAGRKCHGAPDCPFAAAVNRNVCRMHAGHRCCKYTVSVCARSPLVGSYFCRLHGGGIKCKSANCAKIVEISEGFCSKHNGTKRCQSKEEFCDKSSIGSTLLCKRHGGGKRCKTPNCTKSSQGATFFCIGHGGGKRCLYPDGCDKSAIGRTLMCKRHGGGKRCQYGDGCDKSAEGATQMCIRHGGGRRCSIEKCNKCVVAQGLCSTHRGAKVCGVQGCERNYISANLCSFHGGKALCNTKGCQRVEATVGSVFCASHAAASSSR